MSLPRTQLNALHLPCILRAWRFLGPCFVISAVFLFFPRDLPIVSLVANAPREIRDGSMTNLHLQAERQLAAEGFMDHAHVDSCWCNSPWVHSIHWARNCLGSALVGYSGREHFYCRSLPLLKDSLVGNLQSITLLNRKQNNCQDSQPALFCVWSVIFRMTSLK